MSLQLSERIVGIQSENVNMYNYGEGKELRRLKGKIEDMERNYKHMEKQYANRIKGLYQMLNEKQSEYQKLRLQLTHLKYLGEHHKKQVGEMLNKHKKSTLKKNPQETGKSKERMKSQGRTSRKGHQSYSPGISKQKVKVFSPHSHRQLIGENFKRKKRPVENRKGNSVEECSIKPRNYVSPKRDKMGKLIGRQSTINAARKQSSLKFFREKAFILK